MAEAWEEFCDKVKEDLTQEPYLPALFDEELARIEITLPQSSILYRARVGFRSIGRSGIQPFEGADIGPPPPEKAKPGRANVEREVVLYVADQEATAIAEVRPWRGLLVSVAELNIVRDLRLVDLSIPPPPSNPFIDEAPQYELELESLLNAFGEELGRPLRRADDPHDYAPCQKLVRRIRKSGLYDGIRYPSAMVPSGTNLVLFDPKLVKIGPSKVVEVREVGISYGPLEDE
jgi:RES domain-containing protein